MSISLEYRERELDMLLDDHFKPVASMWTGELDLNNFEDMTMPQAGQMPDTKVIPPLDARLESPPAACFGICLSMMLALSIAQLMFGSNLILLVNQTNRPRGFLPL